MIEDPLRNYEPVSNSISKNAACLQDYLTAPEEAAKELGSLLAAEPHFRYRLVYYALKNIRLYFSSDCINGLTAQDVVQIVIEKIILGIRKWNKKLIPDIRILLFLSIKSFIRNEKRRKNNIILMDINNLKSELNETSFAHYCNELNRQDFTDNIFSTNFENIISKLKFFLKDDIYASFVLDEILEGAKSNIEIADKLDISVRDVENAKKRIRNKANKLIK